MYDEWISPEEEKKEKKLVNWILRLFLFVVIIAVLSLIFGGCGTFDRLRCDPTEPKATLHHVFMASPEITIKGYDEDCDGDLDYWQHYMDGEPFARRIYIEKNR